MFKKDDYIVPLSGHLKIDSSESVVAKINYCVKQCEDNSHMYIYKSIHEMSTSQSNLHFTFNKKNRLTNWRYATEEEAEEYEIRNTPYDVTTLVPFVLPKLWHIVITNENVLEVSKWYFDTNSQLTIGYICGVPHLNGEKSQNPLGKFTEKRKSGEVAYDFGIEITFKQFKKHVLKENYIKEDMFYLIKILNKLDNYG